MTEGREGVGAVRRAAKGGGICGGSREGVSGGVASYVLHTGAKAEVACRGLVAACRVLAGVGCDQQVGWGEDREEIFKSADRRGGARVWGRRQGVGGRVLGPMCKERRGAFGSGLG